MGKRGLEKGEWVKGEQGKTDECLLFALSRYPFPLTLSPFPFSPFPSSPLSRQRRLRKNRGGNRLQKARQRRKRVGLRTTINIHRINEV